MQAEFWDHRIRIAQARGFRKILIESDSEAAAIRFLKSGCHETHTLASLLREIKRMVGQNSDIHWRHIYRDANTVVDAFAKNGLSMLMSMHIY